MKRITFEVSGDWSTTVTIEAPDDVPETAMEIAAGDAFEDSFSLKDFMRGLEYRRIDEEESTEIAVLDKHGNIVDWKDKDEE